MIAAAALLVASGGVVGRVYYVDCTPDKFLTRYRCRIPVITGANFGEDLRLIKALDAGRSGCRIYDSALGTARDAVVRHVRAEGRELTIDVAFYRSVIQ